MENTINISEIQNKIKDAFSELHFDEETHSYVWNGKQLLGSTTYIKKFENSFDSYWASEGKAKKNLKENPNDKRTAQYYRKRWEYIRDEASKQGSRVHAFAECYPNFDEPVCFKEQGVIDFFKWFDEKYIMIAQEVRVFDKDTLRAGTIDMIALDRKTGKLVIFDYKTNNKSIFEYIKNLKAPFSDLPETSYNKYCLQLSDYKQIFNKNVPEFPVGECYIVWLINENKDNTFTIKTNSKEKSVENVRAKASKDLFKVYKCRDLSKEIIKDLNDNRENIVKEVKSAKYTPEMFSSETFSLGAFKIGKQKKFGSNKLFK